jgi:hypothetical protein
MDLYGNNIYLNVSSNDSVLYFPDNNASNFRIKLARPLSLIGCWKIGLCEIHICKVVKNDLSINQIVGECISSRSSKDGTDKNGGLDVDTNMDTVDNVNDKNESITPVSGGSGISGIVPKHACRGGISGHTTPTVESCNPTRVSVRIDCSICMGLIVNGEQTRTIRTLAIKGDVYEVFPIVYYVPLETHYIDTIEFHIRSTCGEMLSFDTSAVRVEMTLRLKKC